MTKRLVAYSIQHEAARLAFGAAIAELDPNFREMISDHAIAFESDKNKDELFALLSATGIVPPDEFFIFTVTDSGFGIGIANL